MNEEAKNDGAKSPSKTYIHVVGVILLAAIMASWFALGPLGVFSYIAGRFNSADTFVSAPLLVLPIFVVAVWGLIRLVPRFFHWSKFSHRQRWSSVLLTAVCASFIGSFCLGPSPFEMYMRGFAGYAKAKVDVQATQAWLGTLNPRDCEGQGLDEEFSVSGNPPYGPTSVPCPPHLAWLHSIHRSIRTELTRDDTGQPMIRLSWGKNWMGGWGVVIGNKDMQIPKTQESGWKESQTRGGMERDWEHGEDRRPLAPGVYVWAYIE